MGDAGFTTYLVDDDPAVLRSITRLLKAGGYKTKSFSSPQKFLSSHDPSVPGCAIIDLVMSELDGLRLQEALARSGSQRPIIFLTGRGDFIGRIIPLPSIFFTQCKLEEGIALRMSVRIPRVTLSRKA